MRRPIRSCDLCRTHKLRCDREPTGCANCRIRGMPCQFTEAEEFRRLHPNFRVIPTATSPSDLSTAPASRSLSESSLQNQATSTLSTGPAAPQTTAEDAAELAQLRAIVNVFGRALGFSPAQLSNTAALARLAQFWDGTTSLSSAITAATASLPGRQGRGDEGEPHATFERRHSLPMTTYEDASLHDSFANSRCFPFWSSSPTTTIGMGEQQQQQQQQQQPQQQQQQQQGNRSLGDFVSQTLSLSPAPVAALSTSSPAQPLPSMQSEGTSSRFSLFIMGSSESENRRLGGEPGHDPSARPF